MNATYSPTAHFDNNLARFMAQNAFISKYHFIRSFKAEVGLTPHQFQLQNRIRKAKRLIHNTETITEVALNTGFCDQSYFIKQFEKTGRLTSANLQVIFPNN